ncbi:nitrate reductase molybdenum cofactor assembly chaperone [Methyloversatilis sp.]|uniref:nitrate reductase molybdenum cofactor assembly chaperone n=1 Tax=Methyloversatilis sp. TaxID=2569862 RepID=UPI0027329BDD|nr:nitrate reductase molybdenum cofactor assembly chaperone [Methyloversatilis sp.]MDP2869097.1 nitrate reductase molybdenum cofactor assembly chaperone [Methyloversatilis sp.]MDP3287505.1 nitrate reductase molybdenum cofactor assembly chaperone [Methyloversatilis sp.]MDP3453920.1 nitrate reductase molybdenum cofactor assembly chaperone [Methyloversatilis sp.]MDP3576554.1 nitrate reductase molybdenum cofactor assembly chaperone [Methyloversatilis sp.]
MGLFTASTSGRIAHTLRVAAHLLSYPDAALRAHLTDLHEALHAEGALSASRIAELDALIDRLAQADVLDTEAAYVELFDRGRSTSLHLFEHVHGDSRDRGPAMIDLAQTYEKAGLYLAPGELPDFLPALLEFASTQPPKEARALLAEMAHILNAVFSALLQRQSGYASVLGALIELAGETAQAVTIAPDEPLDESWAEPLAFDGCSSNGQAKPGAVQPIHLVRKSSATQGVQP